MKEYFKIQFKYLSTRFVLIFFNVLFLYNHFPFFLFCVFFFIFLQHFILCSFHNSRYAQEELAQRNKILSFYYYNRCSLLVYGGVEELTHAKFITFLGHIHTYNRDSCYSNGKMYRNCLINVVWVENGEKISSEKLGNKIDIGETSWEYALNTMINKILWN